MSKKFLLVAIVLGVTAASGSQARDKDDDGIPPGQYKKIVQAPEIDPSTALSGLTLLVGGLAVVRGRSKR